jgi:hypothetical protein
MINNLRVRHRLDNLLLAQSELVRLQYLEFFSRMFGELDHEPALILEFERPLMHHHPRRIKGFFQLRHLSIQLQLVDDL